MAACRVRDDLTPVDRLTDRQTDCCLTYHSSRLALDSIAVVTLDCQSVFVPSVTESLHTLRTAAAAQVSCAPSTSLFLWPLTVRGGKLCP
ncbi:hypothetical protein QQF64_021473 [Cirrhinus molitorella]|uniref:Uncharacterized protein n=1 Tax=Cirrhinus molitorella TaxID=172907 RepID=A0ABR3L6Z8_9TELE